jgi:hypothetical protein
MSRKCSISCRMLDLAFHTSHNWLAYCVVYANVSAAMRPTPVHRCVCACVLILLNPSCFEMELQKNKNTC